MIGELRADVFGGATEDEKPQGIEGGREPRNRRDRLWSKRFADVLAEALGLP